MKKSTIILILIAGLLALVIVQTGCTPVGYCSKNVNVNARAQAFR
jgi:hypothetical protein